MTKAILMVGLAGLAAGFAGHALYANATAGAAPPAAYQDGWTRYDGPVAYCAGKPGDPPGKVYLTACSGGQSCWDVRAGGWICHMPPEERPEVRAARASKRKADIDALVRTMGEHRRGEAERLVDLRERAEAARRSSIVRPANPAPANARSAPSTSSSAATGRTASVPARHPAYVPRPNLPNTAAPAGFFDSNRFVTAATEAEARGLFDKFYGTCGGQARYLVSACYPDGVGRYNCQARVRCPLNGGAARGSRQ